MHRLLACLLAVAPLAAACQPEDPMAGPLREPIVGGVPDPGDPSVIMLYAKNTGTGDAWLCTCEVISPHVVLTAAHCLGNPKSPITYRLFLGDDYRNSAQRTDMTLWREVQESARHPDFIEKALNGGNDVGVVITTEALTLKPLPLNRFHFAENWPGMEVRLVGYGKTDGLDSQGITAGTKRQTTTALTNYDSNLMFLGDSTRNTCQGDSGGPAFMTFNGIETVAGITSYGPSGCATGGALTRVDVFLDWIDPFITKWDPTFQNPDLGPPPPPPDFYRAPDMATAPSAQEMPGCSVAGRAPAAPAALAFALLVLTALAARRRR